MAKKKAKGFEESIRELDEMLEMISREETTLEASIEIYAAATGLIKESLNTLKNAEVRIQEIGAALEEADG